jgi:glucose-1-phosphate thymidylyltransferase
VPGLYVYDQSVIERVKKQQPSPRGELEITDLNKNYLQEGLLKAKLLGRGIAWLDTGTPSSLLEAGNYIETIERQQNYKIACLEEIALNRKFIDSAQFEHLIKNTRNHDYRQYLESVLAEQNDYKA